MRVSEGSIRLMRQALQCFIYIGLGHIAFEMVATYMTPEYSHLWYYALLVPGIYYVIPILALLVTIMILEKFVSK